MQPLSRARILVSAFALASPMLMFGRGESARSFRYSQASFKEPPCRNQSIGVRSGGYVMTASWGGAKPSVGQRPNPGNSAFRK
jgi:hypothetical protein